MTTGFCSSIILCCDIKKYAEKYQLRQHTKLTFSVIHVCQGEQTKVYAIAWTLFATTFYL